MKLAIVMLTNGALSGGAAKHLRIVAPMIARDPRVAQLRVFVPEAALGGLPDGIDVVAFDPGGLLSGSPDLDGLLANYAPDTVFIPSARHMTVSGATVVTMVRNMEPLETPFSGNTLLDRAKNIARRHAAKSSCRKSDRTIAVSAHVADYLREQWQVADRKLAIVPHGVGPVPAPHRPGSLDTLGEAAFMFTAGSIRPARGVHDLIAAMADNRVPQDMKMVFAGAVDRGAEGYESRIQAQADALGVADRIHWAGRLDAQEMAWCFENTTLFVMTSRAEACPNTVLEALNHGCLSVSGRNQPMPEFFEDAARYYDIGDASSLAETIAATLALPQAEKDALQRRAQERSRAFTWEKCAERTVDELLRAKA